jgi:hypothetical protein
LSNILISAMLGFAFYSPEMGDSGSMFALGAGAFYGLGAWRDVGLFVGGRAILANVDLGPMSGVNFHIEAPLRAQYYVTDHLSVHLEVGIAISIIGDAGDPNNGRTNGTAFDIGRTNLVNTAGATVYF